MIKLRRCRKCNEPLGDESATCPGCNSNLVDVGVKIVKTLDCPFCGEEIHNSGKSCRKCGARFGTKHLKWIGV